MFRAAIVCEAGSWEVSDRLPSWSVAKYFVLPLIFGQCLNSPAMSIINLTSNQLRKAADLKDEIEGLQNELNNLLGQESSPAEPGKRKRKMNAAARAKIGAAQRARWAKQKGEQVKDKKPRRKMSAAGRARMAAAAKARWAKAKAAGKTRL